MFEKLKKVIKRNCKHQGRNITTGVVVAFLLGSIGTYAIDIVIGWENESITVKQNGSPLVSKDITVEGKTITFRESFSTTTDQITIDSSTFGQNINIVNHGTINVSTGDVTNDNIGNGIGAYDDRNSVGIESIVNIGTIKGSVTSNINGSAKNIGNGIGLYSQNGSSSIGSLKNEKNGIISGSAIEISKQWNNVGNGVGLFSYSDKYLGSSQISTLENSGLISGQTGAITEVGANNVGNGVGVYSYSGGSSSIDSLINTGTISGLVGNIVNAMSDTNDSITVINNAGNGVGLFSSRGSSSIGSLKNNEGGKILGLVKDVSGDFNNAGNGIGLYSRNESSSIGNLTNNGNISGSAGNIESNR